MKRGLLWVAFLLSAGFNLGVVAVLLRDRPVAPAPVAGRVDGSVQADGAATAAEGAATAAEAPVASAASAQVEPAAPQPQPRQPATEPASPPRTQTPIPETRPTAPAPATPTPAPVESAPATALQDESPTSPAPAAGARPAEPPLVDRLGLEGESRAEFVRLQQELAARVRAMQPRIARARADLYRELAAPVPDRQRIEQRITFLARSTAEIERAFADTALRSRELLDPEQERLYLRVLSRRISAMRDGALPPAARRDGARRPQGARPQGARPRLP